MDDPRWHYAQSNKSHRERQMLYVISYMWIIKNKQLNIAKHEQTHRYRQCTSG